MLNINDFKCNCKPVAKSQFVERTADELWVQPSGELRGGTIPSNAVWRLSSSYAKHIPLPWGQELRRSQHLELKKKKKESSRLYTNLLLTMTFFCSILETLRLLCNWICLARRKVCGCEFEWKFKHFFSWPTICKFLKKNSFTHAHLLPLQGILGFLLLLYVNCQSDSPHPPCLLSDDFLGCKNDKPMEVYKNSS